jgi:hypothetical protein
MRIALRILGLLVGVGLGIIGLLIWSISNDGLTDESTTKLVGGASIVLGVVLLVVAFLPKRQTPDRSEDLGEI